jgi:hypothetical protein
LLEPDKSALLKELPKTDLLERKGSIKVSWDVLKENPEAALQVLSNILIVKAENDFITNSIVYFGYSKYFEPAVITDEVIPPEYMWTIHKDENGQCTIEKSEKIGR